jgi:hypothetical protein
MEIPLMTTLDHARHHRLWLGRWLTRLLGLVVEGFLGLLLFLALTNEDPPQPQAWPMLACQVICMVALLLTWRWERLGGVFLAFGAMALAVTALYSGLVTGLGLTGLLVALLYGAPFLIVAGLSLAAGTRAQAGSLGRES